MDDVLGSNFAALDWVIVGCYLSLAIFVGVLANRFTHTVSAYLVGGAASGTALNTATHVGTHLGLVTVMYAAQDAFSNGFSYVTLALIGFVVFILLKFVILSG